MKYAVTKDQRLALSCRNPINHKPEPPPSFDLTLEILSGFLSWGSFGAGTANSTMLGLVVNLQHANFAEQLQRAAKLLCL
jgi:hypothetical protein